MALLIATVLLSLLGIMVEDSAEPKQSAIPVEVPEPPPGHDAEGFFGVSPQTILKTKDYRRMGQGGVDIVRFGLTWDTVQWVPGRCQAEPQVGVCSWGYFDTIVSKAAQKGIRILPTVGGLPEFHREEGTEDFIRHHPPIEGEALGDWRAFVKAAAARYGRGGVFWKAFEDMTGLPAQPIEEWQIWNEPNAAAYWPPEPEAAEYAQLVSETADAIREADPEAEIVLGGMFGTATIDSQDYLADLYEVDGIEEHFDSIAIHPYAPNVRGIARQAKWVRKAAVAAGDSEVGLWVTELGSGSGRGGHELELGNKGQSRLLDRAFSLLLEKRENWNVEGVTWFTWRDQIDGSVCRFCAHAGLFDAEQRAKRSWGTFKSYAKATE